MSRQSPKMRAPVFSPLKDSLKAQFDALLKAHLEAPLTTGAPRLPEVVLYEHENFEGAQWRTNLSYLYVGGAWNDLISSIIVVSGRWQFWEHRDFQGQQGELGIGYYPSVAAAGIPNDIISSFQVIAL